MGRARTLRSRLFSWFLGAIVLAIGTSALVVTMTRPEPTSTVLEAVARHQADRLSVLWNDPDAARAYVDEVRDATGFDARLVRDPRALPRRVRRVAERGGAFVAAGPDRVLVPVVRGGAVLGALEMNRFMARPPAWRWWRAALALFAVVAVLSVSASRVANLLARPLEQLADAADRFGGGDLAHRAEVADAPRWVAVEVRDVAVSFNRMAHRVEGMVRGQRELLGAISHELRSPLGRARVALEIARDRLPPPRPGARSPAEALDEVEKQLGAVDAVLGDLLDVTRAGLADVHKETRPLVEWLRARIADEPTPPPIELEVASGAERLAAAFDAALLARTVHNLLVNARAHGHPPHRPVVVRVARRGDTLRVAVRDEGPGFAPGFAERAFEPFVRGDAARSRPPAGAGYGLGLAIVRRIVEAHGGEVFAHNAHDEEGATGAAATTGASGAEVGFDLPLAPGAG